MLSFLYKARVNLDKLIRYFYYKKEKMSKLTVIVVLAALLVVASNGLITGRVGGYTDRPELVGDSNTKALVSYVAEHLALEQNLILDHLKVIRVQTQLVAGINYKLDFTAEPVNGLHGKITTCQAIIYVRFDSTRKITSAECSQA